MPQMHAIRLIGLGLGIWLAGCAPAASSVRPTLSAAEKPGAAGEGVAAAEEEPDSVSVPSAIRAVTVYSDRALVSREARVSLAAAPVVFAFKRLPGWVDEGSVRAATSAGRIVDVRVTRSYLARATEPAYLKAEARARALGDRLLALDDELAVLEAQAGQVDDIKAFSLDRFEKQVAAGGAAEQKSPGSVGVGTYAGVVDFIGTKMREIAKQRRAVQAEREKLAPEVDASKKRLEELRGLTQLEETKVFVAVQGTRAEEAKLQLTYMLPGATWESTHEVRAAAGDAGSAEVTSFAVVTQASGEDWDQAELTFSTQSSTAAVRIPELEALTLGDTRAATRTIETHSASFTRAETAFKGQNLLWNTQVQRTDLGKAFEESYRTNFESLQVTQSRTVQLFQSLQQRGTTAQFRALSPARVRADGRSVRVPIGRTTLKAKKAIVAAPEQSLNAAQTLEMLNDGGQPLLPGSVALFQAGAFLGMTQLDFLADGEQFAVFLNVADQLKLSRVLDKKRSALVRKQRTEMQLAFVVTIENLSSKPMSLTLADRIPVSEDREIVVSGVKVSPDVKPDSKGILRFALTLQPKEKRKLEIQYRIEYPPTLVLEAKRHRAAEAAAPAGAVAPALPSMRRPYDLKKEIERLEEAF
jgi:uncharacterized protein (TIGR02231 family)